MLPLAKITKPLKLLSHIADIVCTVQNIVKHTTLIEENCWFQSNTFMQDRLYFSVDSYISSIFISPLTSSSLKFLLNTWHTIILGSTQKKNNCAWFQIKLIIKKPRCSKYYVFYKASSFQSIYFFIFYNNPLGYVNIIMLYVICNWTRCYSSSSIIFT